MVDKEDTSPKTKAVILHILSAGAQSVELVNVLDDVVKLDFDDLISETCERPDGDLEDLEKLEQFDDLGALLDSIGEVDDDEVKCDDDDYTTYNVNLALDELMICGRVVSKTSPNGVRVFVLKPCCATS